MPLEVGRSLSHYEILGPLGAGGMGEVYRARDTRLEREVAIKVLPTGMADDTERLRRFEREAKTLASLNHPHVAGIHGVDEVDGVWFLALELVPGEDLRARLARGALPCDEALDVCRQIAEGLEAAHEAGVVHRDLKPANVRVTPEGVVKLLDFGLAKPMLRPHDGSGTSAAESDSFLMTQEGVVLGTPTYMSPEQARGKPVDRRTDVWAFGCVLYECLTGARPFVGEGFSELVVSILSNEVDLERLPRGTPPAARRLLERALVKDPRNRLRDIGEARVALEACCGETAHAGRPAATPGATEDPAPRRRGGSPLALAACALGGILIGAGLARAFAGESAVVAEERTRMQVDLAAPKGTRVSVTGGPPAVFADGSRVAFAALDAEGDTALWVRDLVDGSSHRLPGTEGGAHPFWSPDGRRVGFARAGKLFTIGVDESEPLLLTAGREIAGASWSADGVILFAHRGGPLLRIDARGGPTAVVLDPDPSQDNDWVMWPEFLPDGEHFLFTVQDTSGAHSGLFIGSLDSEEARQLLPDVTNARWVDSGHLLHRRGNAVYASAFDLESFALGKSTRVVKDVRAVDWPMHAMFGASSGGRVVYYRDDPQSADSSFVWYDGETGATEDLGVTGILWNPRLSQDGLELAFDRSTRSTSGDVWTRDLARGTELRLTDRPSDDSWPVWSSSGDELFFYCVPDLYRVRPGSSTTPELLYESPSHKVPLDLTPDQRGLLYLEQNGEQAELRLLDLASLESSLLLASAGDARLSPDGKWICYQALAGEREDLTLAAFPALTLRKVVSPDSGSRPCWRPDGGELFFVREGEVLAVPVTLRADAPPELGAERVVVRRDSADRYLLDRGFDTSPRDGRLLLVRSDAQNAGEPLTLVDNGIETP